MTDILDRARKALGEHAWPEAYDSFSALDAEGSLDPEDLEQLGEAAWWSAHPKESLDVASVSSLQTGASTFVVANERDVSLKGIDQPVRVATIDWRS